jgi:predicted transposase YbfD/YdcC
MAKKTPSKYLPDIVSIFATVADPRRDHRKLHALPDVLAIALCTILCGHSEFTEMEAFGEAREDWLRDEIGLGLANGIPSHDTFRNVFAALDPAGFLEAFILWTEGVRVKLRGEIVAIDGKALRGTKGDLEGLATMVGAWATDAGISLGQVQVEGKSNEITAVPKLLERLDLKGCTVTGDAMLCQRDIAAKCIEQRADYVFSLKGNQGKLRDEVGDYFEGLLGGSERPEPDHITEERGRGRVETRRCWVMDGLDEWLGEAPKWKGLRSVAAVELERTSGGKTTRETRYFISSLPADAEKIAHAARAHWGIENSLHWVLDVIFGEDAVRARTRNMAGNLSSLRRLTLNLLKADDEDPKWGPKRKRFEATHTPAYLKKLLGKSLANLGA